VYINEDDLKLDDNEILVSEYPLYEVYNGEELVGRISEYRNDNGNEMIKINDKFIPYNKDFISKIDKTNKKIYMHDIGVFL
jgi:ribosomal 30S subunit maturation factor RimM